MTKPDAVHVRQSNEALCLSLEQNGNGEVLVIFDAVTRKQSSESGWRQEAFITNVTVGEDQLRGMKFSDEDLAEFGRTVLGSLAIHLQRKRS
jgi:hypothetical protein